MNALQFMFNLNKIVCGFWSIERPEKVSNGEIKRWFKNNAIHVNGKPIKMDEEMPNKITSFVLFPNAKRKTTLY